MTPTLASLRALDAAGTEEYTRRLAAPEMIYEDSGTISWWRSLSRGNRGAYTPSPYYRFEADLVRVLRDTGTRLLLGTDAPNPLMVPGFSVHDEIEVLVRDTGLSPYEVLRMATTNTAEFLGDSLAGRVGVGARADLILVDANPLTDIRVLRRPLRVMVAGRLLDRAALDAALEQLRSSVR